MMVTNLDKKMLTGFSREVRSYLPSIRESIDGFRDNAAQHDGMEEALRFIHTIKGASGLMGLAALNQLTSYVEEMLEGIIAGHVAMDTDRESWLAQTMDRIEPYLDDLLDGDVDNQALFADLEQSYAQLRVEVVREEPDGEAESDIAEESMVTALPPEPSDDLSEDPEDPSLMADWSGEVAPETMALDSEVDDTGSGASEGTFGTQPAEFSYDEDDLSNLPEDAWVFDTIGMDERELAETASPSEPPGEDLSQDELSISDDDLPSVEEDVVTELSDEAVESLQNDDELAAPLLDPEDELAFAGDEDRESPSVSDSQITPSESQEQEDSEEDQELRSEMLEDDLDDTAIYDAPDIDDIIQSQEEHASHYKRFETAAVSPAMPGALDELISSIDQEVRQVYHHDALSVASSRSSLTYTSTGERYVVFVIAGSWYAVSVASILEIGRIPSITTIPNVPLWVSGVINLRGEIISVIDLRTFLGIEEAYQIDSSRMLVVKTQGEEITTSLVVDQVRGFVRLDTDQMDAASVPLDDWVTPYLKGVFEYENQALAVMDLDRFLLSPEIRQFD